MAGFIQIVIYILCVYLVFKGVEIFQIGLANNTSSRGLARAVGIASLLIAVAAAVGFFMFEEFYAADFANRTNNIPNFGR